MLGGGSQCKMLMSDRCYLFKSILPLPFRLLLLNLTLTPPQLLSYANGFQPMTAYMALCNCSVTNQQRTSKHVCTCARPPYQACRRRAPVPTPHRCDALLPWYCSMLIRIRINCFSWQSSRRALTIVTIIFMQQYTRHFADSTMIPHCDASDTKVSNEWMDILDDIWWLTILVPKAHTIAYGMSQTLNEEHQQASRSS